MKTRTSKSGTSWSTRLAHAFWAGDLKGCLEIVEDQGSENLLAHAAELVGAYVFGGQMEEAVSVYNAFKNELSSEARVGSQFYLMIGFVRSSEILKAQRCLKLIRHELLKKRTASNYFYFYQAWAFFNYYQSRFLQAEKFVNKALEWSWKAKFAFGEMLSRDLYGHCLVHTGKISKGLDQIYKAKQRAQQLNNSRYAFTFHLSALCIESQFGRLKNSKMILEKALAEIEPSDTFSINQVHLELARQHMLTGSLHRAESILNQVAHGIHRHLHQRQSALMHHGLAQLMFLKGLYEQALTLLNIATQQVNRHEDYILFCKLSGLREKVSQSLNLGVAAAPAEERDMLGQRISARRLGVAKAFPRGEDPLGDDIDEIFEQGQRKEYSTLIEKQLWAFLPDVLRFDRRKPHLIVDLEPRSLTLFHGGNVSHFPELARGYMRKAIQILSRGPQTKSYLIEKVWNYSYDPLRHDPLVYQLLGRLRRYVNQGQEFLQFNETSYSLNLEVMWLERASQKTRLSAPGTEVPHSERERPRMATVSIEDSLPKEFNYRQVEWLRINRADYFGIKEYKKQFAVSTMTAFRDLDEMLKIGYLEKRGFGRATKYRIVVE